MKPIEKIPLAFRDSIRYMLVRFARDTDYRALAQLGEVSCGISNDSDVIQSIEKVNECSTELSRYGLSDSKIKELKNIISRNSSVIINHVVSVLGEKGVFDISVEGFFLERRTEPVPTSEVKSKWL